MKTINTIDFEQKNENNIKNIDNINKKINKKTKKIKKKKEIGVDSVKLYLDEISKYDLLSSEEEKELSKKIQEDHDEEALEKLINSNLRLVVKIARNYISSGYPFIDIIQDGNMGLIKAAKKFDYKKDVRFSTYASWWIKQTIIRNLSIKKRMIRLSHRKEEKLRKLKKTKIKYYQKNKCYPTDEELSDMLKISIKEIKEINMFASEIVSIEENISDDDQNYTLQKMIGDESYIPDKLIENEVLAKETEKLMNSLVPRERVIIAFRYGFNDQNKKYTLKKMGEMFGISAETVRQIEMKALAKLRKNFAYLKDFIN